MIRRYMKYFPCRLLEDSMDAGGRDLKVERFEAKNKAPKTTINSGLRIRHQSTCLANLSSSPKQQTQSLDVYQKLKSPCVKHI